MNPNSHNDESKPGFVKLMRSPESQELLLNDPLAFALLAVIALRARWRTAIDVHDLRFGEALLGDYKKIGFARRQYRTRLARLVKWGLTATRPTRKGTIATITSTAVFDINLSPREYLTSEESAENRPSKWPAVLPLKNCAERPTQRPTGGQQAANKRPLTNNDKKERKKDDQGTLKALGSSTPAASDDVIASDFCSGSHQNQNQPAQTHVKWPEFAAWCRSKGGQPSEEGFWSWLCKQKPQWRNKVRQKFDGEEGYELNGKFFTTVEANQLGAKNPELLPKFRKATKSGDKIHVIDPPSGVYSKICVTHTRAARHGQGRGIPSPGAGRKHAYMDERMLWPLP